MTTSVGVRVTAACQNLDIEPTNVITSDNYTILSSSRKIKWKSRMRRKRREKKRKRYHYCSWTLLLQEITPAAISSEEIFLLCFLLFFCSAGNVSRQLPTETPEKQLKWFSSCEFLLIHCQPRHWQWNRAESAYSSHEPSVVLTHIVRFDWAW